MSVTLADVQAARIRILRYVHRTPVLTSRLIDQLVGARVFFKCEVFQRTGAFKARGAFSRALLLTPEEKKRGIVAFSSGNHAQAVALAAGELGIASAIVMPNDAPLVKVAATRGYGARIIHYDRNSGPSREEIAWKLVSERGCVLIPPFDDDAVIAGQGTLAIELMDEVPGLDVVLVPVGGGGLISGVSVAAHGLRPDVRVLGVEPEAGDDMRRSMAERRVVTIDVPSTIADSLQTLAPAERTLAIVREHVEAILTVTDLEIRRAMALLFSRLKLVVEPGGAVGFAALLHRKVSDAEGKRIAIVLSGGNVDPEKLSELFAGLSPKRGTAAEAAPVAEAGLQAVSAPDVPTRPPALVRPAPVSPPAAAPPPAASTPKSADPLFPDSWELDEPGAELPPHKL